MDSLSQENLLQSIEGLKEQKIQENITNWQSGSFPLAKLSEPQLDIIYHVKDLIDEHYCRFSKDEDSSVLNKVCEESKSDTIDLPVINTCQDYIKWMVKAENEMKLENLKGYFAFYNKLDQQASECELLFNNTEDTINRVDHLNREYQEVTSKTDSLHSISEQLMNHQKELKDKKTLLKERLHYFKLYHVLNNNINHNSDSVNNSIFIESLDKIDECLDFLHLHPNFKETKSYTTKFEHLLSKAMVVVRRYFNNVIVNYTKQITTPENTNSLSPDDNSVKEPNQEESTFSIYYGKFQNAAIKVKSILQHIQDKIDKHNSYKQLLFDCQQTYFTQRTPVMTDAITKALAELKIKHKNDYSTLFRASCIFIIQICQDEVICFNYFFAEYSEQLHEYFGILCQNLYDMLRPSLIGIYHLEVLTELCGILRGEMLNDQIQNNEILFKFVEIVRQLLEDVEERLVFRTHIFFHNDLKSYDPSPGDLAYPEKLEQMENITEDISEIDKESRSSVASMESQEVANINTNHITQFRSYTGNSPADLHGMWYPTVKRTLVCLSRLYFCLDREIFQGLAQEALSICIDTITKAADQITAKKSPIDGMLFHIKHLLILREQIAPFQVDFTIKEVGLDFSNLKTAAVGLIHNRNKLFTFSSNNAFLEFLLEGTPRVKEYLLDSRKDIDKQLKNTCETFITYGSILLIENMLKWIQDVESYLKVSNALQESVTLLNKQEFAKPEIIAKIINDCRRNIKTKIPDIQRSMQLYLANRETEFILFRPIKNNIINAFSQVENILEIAKYDNEVLLKIACPTPEQVNILICSASLTIEQDNQFGGYNS